jgi:hypothetical protein
MNTKDSRGRTSDLHSDLVQAIARARDLGRGQAVDIDLVQANHVAREIAVEISRATELERAVDDTDFGGLSADLANAGVHAEEFARTLAQIQDCVRVRDRVFLRFSIEAAVSNLDHACKIVGIAAAPGQRHVMPSVGCLLAAAAWMLPAADRERYAGEYRSELWELARAGDGRIKQLRYALRQLRSAPSMRFAMRSPRRRSARQ